MDNAGIRLLNGLQEEVSEFGIEQRGGVEWKVFYVVAPDGLCYWFGERQLKYGRSDRKVGSASLSAVLTYPASEFVL